MASAKAEGHLPLLQVMDLKVALIVLRTQAVRKPSLLSI